MSTDGRATTKAGALGSVIVAAIVPKCPLCVAAALSAAGVSVGIAQSVAPYLRISMFVIAGSLTVMALWRLRHRPKQLCCSREA